MNFDPTVTNDARFYDIGENLQSPISKETALASWLIAIESYSRDSSDESRAAVIKLAKDLPDCQFAPEDIQEGIKKIRDIAQLKNWDPTLSPKSSKLLQSICRDYFPQSNRTKPSCARKLDFV